MKHALATLISVLALSGAAPAADSIVEETPIAGSAYDWSGFYVGLFGGYGWGDADKSSGGDLPPPFVDEPFVIFDDIGEEVGVDQFGDGGLGGLRLGHNWQSGNIVFGVEADAALTSIHGEEYLATNLGDARLDVDVNFLGTARGRVGFAAGRFLPYFTGGVAVANVKVHDVLRRYSDSNIHVGWAVGAGAELGITDRLSLNAEYLYADLGEDTYDLNGGGVATGYPLAYEPTLHTTRIGLNLRF